MDAMKLMNKLLEGCNSAADEPAMPEVILPCPACGKDRADPAHRHHGQYSVICPDCYMLGPSCGTQQAAIAAWNKLPRALTWTHEPPQVAGKYWWRPSGKKIGHIRDMFVRSGEIGFLDMNNRFIKDIDDGEWAGPIAPPIEP